MLKSIALLHQHTGLWRQTLLSPSQMTKAAGGLIHNFSLVTVIVALSVVGTGSELSNQQEY